MTRTRKFSVACGLIVVVVTGAVASGASDPAVEQANGEIKKVESLLEAAQKEGDMIKFNCVNDNLSNLRGSAKVLEASIEARDSAAKAGETDTANYEASKIKIAQGNITKYASQAAACKGEVARYTGSTEKKEEVDPNQSGASFADKTTGSTITSVSDTTQTRPTSATPSY